MQGDSKIMRLQQSESDPTVSASVLEWMHEQVKAQMRDHAPGTCATCDEKRHRRPRGEYGPTPPDINENET